MLTDTELLQIEIATLWVSDARDRLVKSGGRNGRPAPHLVIAVAIDGQTAAIGSEVPDDAAAQLRAVIDQRPHSGELATPPSAIAHCVRLLEAAVGPVELSSGPSYLVPLATPYASAAEIIRSDSEHAARLRDPIPERANWSAEEWHELIDGGLGPWAVAIAGGRVVSICHSARLTERGAEAGVWTDPDHRGKGMAAAVTAAWSSLFSGSGRHLFYSTSAGNASSQRVAARLGLRLIGYTWRLSAPATA